MPNNRIDKSRRKKSCGDCYWRDYGTDSHYVCQEGDVHFRVRKDGIACDYFKKKDKSNV